ncbi:acyl-CoA dehydrogenase [Salmonella enterica]|nr:acyl-CoA dehydrogenase [Salmonella enterica]
MKRSVSVLLFIVSIPMAHASEYMKRDGALSLFQHDGDVEFNINASHGNTSGVCNMEGIARSVGAGTGQRNRWTYSDPTSACVAVISELNDGSISVMTRSCENYCGVSAEGALDGKYMMK